VERLVEAPRPPGAAPPAAEYTARIRLHTQAGFLRPAGGDVPSRESAAMPGIVIRRRRASKLTNRYTSNTPYRAARPSL